MPVKLKFMEEIKMEKQYAVVMTITVDDDKLENGQAVDELVLDALEEAPFQVDCLTVNLN